MLQQLNVLCKCTPILQFILVQQHYNTISSLRHSITVSVSLHVQSAHTKKFLLLLLLPHIPWPLIATRTRRWQSRILSPINLLRFPSVFKYLLTALWCCPHQWYEFEYSPQCYHSGFAMLPLATAWLNSLMKMKLVVTGCESPCLWLCHYIYKTLTCMTGSCNGCHAHVRNASKFFTAKTQDKNKRHPKIIHNQEELAAGHCHCLPFMQKKEEHLKLTSCASSKKVLQVEQTQKKRQRKHSLRTVHARHY